MDVILFLW